MRSVFLVRHGESIWNHSSKFTGWTNIPLTTKGKEEGTIIAKTLRNNKIIPNVFFSSVLTRSIDTASIVKRSLNSSGPTYTSWRLNEKHYGTLEGVPRDYIREEYGAKFTNLLRSNFYLKPPIIPEEERLQNPLFPVFKNCYFRTIEDGESKENVLNRVLPYFENDILCTLDEGLTPLVVSHKHCIRVLMKHYLKLNDEEFDRYNIQDKNIVELKFDDYFELQHISFISY